MSALEEMTKMWNSRYATEEYAYGIAPNHFLKTLIDERKLVGKILFPAEGEGRNAVYAARQGLNVTAFDISIEGKKKALQLAEREKVKINYEVGNFFDLDLVNEKYDAAALIYAHFPPPLLSPYHRKIADLIKPGGIVMLEGFSKGHLPYRNANPKVGGPNKLEMLFSKASIQNDFPDFHVLKLEDIEVELNEGAFHIGTGKVIRYIGQKTK
jgi:cyclopropane fatty-acyl-phospholipid synthase-like methyltransferase